MASSYSSARFSTLSDEIFAEDIEPKSKNNDDIILRFSHAHSSLLDSVSDTDVGISCRSFQGDDHSIDASFQHTKARCKAPSAYRYMRQFIFVIIVVAITFSLAWVVNRREGIFNGGTSDDYFFENKFKHYIDFLRWGHSGSNEIMDNLNTSFYIPEKPLSSGTSGSKDRKDKSATRSLSLSISIFDFNSTDVGSSSEEGWANICPYTEMMQFVTGSNDDVRCNYLNPGGYVRGCTGGFYQPGMNLDADPRPCPNGFMCPHNFVCTVACVPGTQCFNSTLDRTSENCVYPPAMNIYEAVDPLYLNTMDESLGLTSNKVPLHDITANQKVVCPGTANLVLCEGGRFCETASSSAMCPTGYFCPLGSIAPTRCPLIANCDNDGTQHPNYGHGIIVLCTVLVGTFVIALVVFQKIRSHFRLKRRLARQSSKLDQQRELHRASNKCILQDPLLDESCPPNFSIETEPLSSLRDKRESMIELTFKSLGITLRSNGMKVINGVSGSCRPGRLTAIMGPSGAGKTTLLNALCGRATHGLQSGTLLVNGAENSIASYSDFVGFVPQDDIMHDDLTVKETLLMYSGLRLPSTLTRAERIAIVADVMAVLDIREISHAVIGSVEKRGISGGQRKRVNIAIEMVADPSLLFLDEPTSGLDSNTSFSVLLALKKLSRKGANVIAVLHQPSYEIFQLLDDVIFLSNGGQSAFLGPASEASSFFTKAGFTCPPMLNPGDFFLDVIAGSKKYQCQRSPHFNSSDGLIKLWKVHESEYISDVGRSALKPFTPLAHPAGFWCSLRIFMMRAAIQQLRAYKYFISDLMLESFAGVLVGILFPHVPLADFNKWLCFMAMGLGLTVSIASLRVFGNERVVFWREAAFIDISAYFLAKNIVELPRIAGLTLFFVLASYPIVTPNLEWIFCWAFCCAATFAISGFAYFVSIALNPLKAQLCTVTYVLVAVMFSGLATTSVVSFKGNPFFMTLSYLSVMRWLSELVFLRQAYSLSLAWRMPPPCYENATESSELHWLLMFGLTPISEIFSLDVAMLLLLGITFRILAFASLVLCNRNKRGLRTYRQIISHQMCNPCDVYSRQILRATILSSGKNKDGSQSEFSPPPSELSYL